MLFPVAYRIGATAYPRLQFWSAEEHFAGLAPRLPSMAGPYTGRKAQLEMFADGQQSSLRL